LDQAILSWISYSSERPLIFTQLYFWVFFALVLGVYSFIYPKLTLRNAYLFGISLFFYYKTSGLFFIILIFSTLVDYFIGKKIYKAPDKIIGKRWLALSITINLTILCYFKYAYFFTDSFNLIFQTDYAVFNHLAYWSNGFFGTHFSVSKILLPVGISFYTFQTISYSVDIYRGHIKPVRHLTDFGFYVSFFPQLVAGPIVRASEFIPQLYQPYQLTRHDFGMAIFWILNGLMKKMFLADYIAVNFIDRVFANPGSFSGFENLVALFGYSLQVYADFSGYTDIAIGVALLLGFRLPVNFNSPYKATSVGDFWRRWHISLSTWLRDYLYIPMGGNRTGSFFSYLIIFFILIFVALLAQDWRVFFGGIILGAILAGIAVALPIFKRWLDTNVNLMITMTLGGLWHGASWNMVWWGALNGIGLMVFKLWKKISPWADHTKWYFRAWSIALTLVFITFTRTWFRGESFDSANLMLQRIWHHFQAPLIGEILLNYKYVFGMILLGYLIHWIPTQTKQWYRDTFASLPMIAQGSIAFAVIFLIYQVLSSELQPFIYFVF
jgi:alginate O-acetyltransferase complex protein AlgI